MTGRGDSSQGGSQRGGSGFGDPEALAQARALAASFKSGGKDSEQRSGGQGRGQGGSAFGGARGGFDNAQYGRQPRPSPLNERAHVPVEEPRPGAAPLPSQRDYQSLQAFIPGSKGSNKDKYISGAAALAFLNFNDKEQSPAQPATQGQPSKAPATPTAVGNSAAQQLRHEHPDTLSQKLSGSPATQAGQGSTSVTQQKPAVDPQVPLSMGSNLAPSVAVTAGNAAPVPVSITQSGSMTSKAANAPRPRAVSAQIGGQAEHEGGASDVVNRDLQQPGRSLKLSSPDAVLAQLQKMYCPNAAPAPSASSTAVTSSLPIQAAAAPPATNAETTASRPNQATESLAIKAEATPSRPTQTNTHTKATEELKNSVGSTTSSVVTAFRDLKLEDKEEKIEVKTERQTASTQPAALTGPKVVQPRPSQQPSFTKQSQLEAAKAWMKKNDEVKPKIEKSPETKVETKVEPEVQKETATLVEQATPAATHAQEPVSPAAAPKRKKAPGLESSMFNRPQILTHHNYENEPSAALSAQAKAYSPSTTGRSETQLVMHTPVGMTRGSIATDKQASTMDHVTESSSTAMVSNSAREPGATKVKRGLKYSIWNK